MLVLHPSSLFSLAFISIIVQRFLPSQSLLNEILNSTFTFLFQGVYFTVNYFNTESCCDKVRFYSASNVLLHTSAGTAVTSIPDMPQVVRVNFLTDSSVVRQGFSLTYVFRGKLPCSTVACLAPITSLKKSKGYWT